VQILLTYLAMDVTALTATGDSDLTVTKVKNGITSVDASVLRVI